MKIIPLLLTFATVPTAVMAVDNNWTGTTSTDWNTDTNWSDPHGFGSPHVPNNGPGHPGDEDAVINTSTGNIATISANLAVQMRDIKVGIGAGQVGIVNHTAGTAGTGGGNWLFIGRDGGNGTYNQSGGQLNGNGERTLIGSSVGSTGTYNISGGTLAASDQLQIGDEGGTGKVVQTGGAVTSAQRLRIGTGGAGSLGTYQQSAGTVAVGDIGGNTHFVVVGGQGGGTGRYDIAGGAGAGTYTGLATGSGSVNADRFYVGGFEDAAGGNGTVNINTTGTVAMSNDLMVGRGGGTGVVNLDAGTVTTGGWNFIGQGDNAPGGNGTVRISGGLLNNGGGRTYLGYNNSQGHLVMSGGEYRNTGDWTAVGHNNLANATASTVSLTGGLLNVNLLSVGGSPDEPGKGSLSMTGPGQVTTGELWIGNRVGSVGSMTVSSGIVNSGSWLAVGRDGATGVLTINGTGVVQKTDLDGSLEITNANAATANGTVNLDGGSLNVNNITGSGGVGSTAILNLNGGILRPIVDDTDFIEGNVQAIVRAGGAKIDTNGFNIGIQEALADGGGGGGLNKLGSGTLTLTQTNTYTGPTTVSGGTLLINGSLSNGLVTVNSGATIGGSGTIGGNLNVAGGAILAPGTSPGTLTTTGSATFASTSVLNYELSGTDQTAGGLNNDLLNVAALTLDGTINIAETATFAGLMGGETWRLINYTGALTNLGLVVGSQPASLPSGFSLVVNTATPGQVNLVAVPEPTTTGIMGLALAALGLRRRRK